MSVGLVRERKQGPTTNEPTNQSMYGQILKRSIVKNKAQQANDASVKHMKHIKHMKHMKHMKHIKHI